MQHQLSAQDKHFRDSFEACLVPSAEFSHRAHIWLAYCYLCENETELAYQKMRTALQSFLVHHGVDATKYHETMTKAWLMAVRHFMVHTPPVASAAAFIERNPRLLDTGIMLTHYSEAVLFSDEARVSFVAPDLDAIPHHA